MARRNYSYRNKAEHKAVQRLDLIKIVEPIKDEIKAAMDSGNVKQMKSLYEKVICLNDGVRMMDVLRAAGFGSKDVNDFLDKIRPNYQITPKSDMNFAGVSINIQRSSELEDSTLQINLDSDET